MKIKLAYSEKGFYTIYTPLRNIAHEENKYPANIFNGPDPYQLR
jgi:hypothetical protein